MILVGLTGGIGSGKTTVANMFSELGIPVYIADIEAKKLMNTSKVIKLKLIALFGEDAYIDNTLNKSFIAGKIFKDKKLLNQMNAIVHPKVSEHFQKWKSKQKAPYVIKETAILFENNSYQSCDYIITITAPKDVRINRVITRDHSSKEKVEAIIKNQWSDQEKIKRSQFVIHNMDLKSTKAKVLRVHTELLKLLKKPEF